MKSLEKIIAAAVLFSLLFIALGGVLSIMHMGSDMSTYGCPFTPLAQGCPPGSLDQTLHHLSAYSSFFSFPVLFTFFTIIFFAICILLFLGTPPDLPLASKKFVRINSPPEVPVILQEKSWLSLFEHSPSLA